MGEIKKQINNIQNRNSNSKDQETQIHQNDGVELDKKEMQNEAVIHADVTFRGENQKQCSFRTDIMPAVDIQVCTQNLIVTEIISSWELSVILVP